MTRIPRAQNAEFLVATPKPKPRKPPKNADALFEDSMRKAQRFCEAVKNKSVALEDLTPQTVVGLYIMLHTWIYGCEPTELRKRTELLGAFSAARRLIGTEFGGAIDQVFEFVRWTWAREKIQLQNRDGDWRVTWRYQFSSAKLLTDYRVFILRSTKVAR